MQLFVRDLDKLFIAKIEPYLYSTKLKENDVSLAKAALFAAYFALLARLFAKIASFTSLNCLERLFTSCSLVVFESELS
jgi:hypothetical protein